MKNAIELRGNFRRIGVELPTTPQPIRKDLRDICLNNRTNMRFNRVYQDVTRGELYFITSEGIYFSRFTEQGDDLLLRDKEFLTDRIHSREVHVGIRDYDFVPGLYFVANFERANQRFCLQYPKSVNLSTAFVKNKNTFGPNYAELYSIKVR